MQYRSLCGEKISVLGYGCMRFPTVNDKIDEKTSADYLEYAFKSGVNYYDTAYPYHNGESEGFLGRTIVKNHRKDIYLATKCPVWLLKTADDFDRIFNEQLTRLGTDYVDFYLMHALDAEGWDTVKQFDLLTKAAKLKSEGKIRHIGFSFHDSLDVFKEIINGWDGWEFCQIQLNYINVDHQAGIAGLEYAKEKGLDVIIMEPLLGGRLANPPSEVKKVLGSAKPPVEFALDFLWNRPEISILLSGMGAMEQVEQNIMSTADRAQAGMALLKASLKPSPRQSACSTADRLLPAPAVHIVCHVRQGWIFRAYTSFTIGTAWHGKKDAKAEYDKLEEKADSCISCGACLAHCPQNINSPEIMPEIVKAFE